MDTREGVQKLHAEIDSNEACDEFLEREGLLVMDVYTEWCGPCICMSLEQLKREVDGDNLHLAKCKSNKIAKCLSGTNMPVLLETIAEQLQLEEKCKSGKYKRKSYDWNCLPTIQNKNTLLTKPDTAIPNHLEVSKMN